MATFVINEGHEYGVQTVEADTYELKNGYFTFFDGNGAVLTIAERQVSTVKRQE